MLQYLHLRFSFKHIHFMVSLFFHTWAFGLHVCACTIMTIFHFYIRKNSEYQGGQWHVYYTSPPVFKNSYSLAWILISWFIKLSAQTLHLQPLIVIYRSSNFVHHHWRYTLICLIIICHCLIPLDICITPPPSKKKFKCLQLFGVVKKGSFLLSTSDTLRAEAKRLRNAAKPDSCSTASWAGRFWYKSTNENTFRTLNNLCTKIVKLLYSVQFIFTWKTSKRIVNF